MSRFVGALVLSGLLAAPVGAQTEQRSVKGSIVAIYNLAGRMRAVAGSGDAVVVEITRGGADAAKLRVESGTIGGREALRIIYPSDRIVYPNSRSRTSINVRSDGTFGDGSWQEFGDRDRVDIRSYGPGLEAFADLLVRIPKGQKIELFLAVGRAEITNVDGDVVLDVSAAEVDIAGVKGSLLIDSGSGRVAVRDVTGNLNIDSGSGGLSIERVTGDVLHIDSGSGSVQGNEITVRELRADVGSGGLRLFRVKAPQVIAETGSGGITLELMSDIERLDVETGSGGATIRAPATLSAEVDAETGSGGFSSDFDIITRRLSRNHIEGRIGDGRGRIRIEAGSGSVRLLKN